MTADNEGYASATCHAHIATFCGGEAIPVVVRERGGTRRTRMCAACRTTARSMGADVVDERPEWLRRLTARDETGRVLTPEGGR